MFAKGERKPSLRGKASVRNFAHMVRRWARRLTRVPLPVAVFAAVGFGAAIMVYGIPVIRHFAGAETANIDVLRVTLTTVAGIGGLVALVVTYRRQNDVERSRFTERYGAAAAQLGNADSAVRIAGVYAMAGVADESSKFSRRQQCIDVLCGYLRQPYDPRYGSSHHTEMVTASRRLPSETATAPIEKSETERRVFRQNDREVRKTIVRVICDHARPAAEVSWSKHNFDFATAVLEDADFIGTHFKGASLSFVESVFVGKYTRFGNATLESDSVWFDRAVFSAGITHFENCRFRGHVNSFGGAGFHGSEVHFDRATFARRRSGSYLNFLDAIFDGDVTTFDGAVFESSEVLLARMIFDCRIISFVGASFAGAETIFSETQFGLINTVPARTITLFTHARFVGKSTVFMNCKFSGKHTSFDWPQEWRRVQIHPHSFNVYPKKWEPAPTTVRCPVIAWAELLENDDDTAEHYTLHIVNVLADQPIYSLGIDVQPPSEEAYRIVGEVQAANHVDYSALAADDSWIYDISGGGFDGGSPEVLVPKDERTKSFSSPIPLEFFEIVVTFVHDDRMWSLGVRTQRVGSSPINYGSDDSASTGGIAARLKRSCSMSASKPRNASLS